MALFRRREPGVGHPRVAICHIPKTAGTSLLRVVQRNCRDGIVHLHYPPERVSRPPASPLATGLLVGHFPLGYESAFFATCDRVVFLREPIERLRSHLAYERRYFLARRASPHARWFRENDDLVAFVEHSRLWYLDNALVRFLSGVGESVPFGELAAEHLDRARARLAEIDFVGFHATFERDARRLMQRYGWMGRVPRLNASPRAPAVEEEGGERLRAYNRLDLELYAHAWERYRTP